MLWPSSVCEVSYFKRPATVTDNLAIINIFPLEQWRIGGLSHPSLKGRVAKIATRKLVYYILIGTLRGSQKYH